MGIKPLLRKNLRIAAGISIICPLIVFALYHAGALQRLEYMAFDSMMRHSRMDKPAHKDIAIVLIDEASLKAMNPVVGRWPWPRDVHAEVLDFIMIGGPKAVVFDIYFTEYEQGLHEGFGRNDRALAMATKNSGVAYHAAQVFIDTEDETNKTLLNRDMPKDFTGRFALKTASGCPEAGYNNYAIPISELYPVSKGIGIVEFTPDGDGAYRRTRMLRNYKGDCLGAMGIAPVIDSLGIKNIWYKDGMLMLGDLRMPVAEDGNYLINLYGKYNEYSISGLLSSIQKLRDGRVSEMMVDPEEFRDKIVFIGASAAGVEDLKLTPLWGRTPGVYLHASVASNIMQGDFLMPAPKWFLRSSVIVLSAVISFGVLMLTRTTLRVALPAVLIAGYSALAYGYFGRNIVMEVIPPSLGALASFTVSFVYLSLTEGREKRKIRKMLGQYVSPDMLSVIVDRHDDFLKAEVGSNEHVTVLFSDIRGFTSISEHEPPDRIVGMLNQYFTLWSDVIFKHKGTIDKFVGDAVMAMWGAPVKTNDHAKNAVLAAFEMMERLPALNEELAKKGYPHVKIGIGINTGYAILGNIGSERKLDYTVIGDTVNLASRLEGLTKQYSCDILISEATCKELEGGFKCEFVDNVKVKGKETAVAVYKVVGKTGKGALK